MTAMFPLQSCRMFHSRLSFWDRNFGERGQPVDDNGARLRTAIEADAASGAVVAGVTGGMNSVGTHFRGEFQALRRAGLDAEPASLALLDINGDVAACCARHVLSPPSLLCRCLCYLRMLQPLGLFAIFVELGAEVRMRDLDQRFGSLA